MSDPREAARSYRRHRTDDEGAERDRERGEASAHPTSAPPARSYTPEERAAYVETAIQQAIRRGEFDNLPGAGKPLPGLGASHDPDWWLRRKIEAEGLTGLGPPALTLRTEYAQLQERLDEWRSESEVREHLEDFNRRVIEARRQLLGGPPVVTPTVDVDDQVRRWRERADAAAEAHAPPPAASGRRWLRRRDDR